MKKICASDFDIIDLPLENIVIYDGINDRLSLGEIDSLAAQISEVGMHTEVWCRQHKSGHYYELFAGKRRYAAHKQLDKETIRAKVFKNLNDIDIPYMQWLENDNRKDLGPIEKVNFIIQLIDIEIKHTGQTTSLIKHKSLQAFILAKAISKHRHSNFSCTDARGEIIIEAAIKVVNKTGAFKSIWQLEKSIALTTLPDSAKALFADGRIAVRPAITLAIALRKICNEEAEEIISCLLAKEGLIQEADVKKALDKNKALQVNSGIELLPEKLKGLESFSSKINDFSKFKKNDQKDLFIALEKIEKIIKKYSSGEINNA